MRITTTTTTSSTSLASTFIAPGFWSLPRRMPLKPMLAGACFSKDRLEAVFATRPARASPGMRNYRPGTGASPSASSTETTTSSSSYSSSSSSKIDSEAVEASETQLDAELSVGGIPSVAHAAEIAAALAEEQLQQQSHRNHHQIQATKPAASSAASEAAAAKTWRQRAAALLHSPHDASIVALAIPALGSLLLDPIMTAVDTALVGRLVGTAQLAGVGLSSITLTFFVVLCNPLIFLTTPAVASAAARGDTEEASRVTARGLWVAMALGSLGAAALFAAAPSMMTWLAASNSSSSSPAAAASKVATLTASQGEVARHAAVYIQCRSMGFPALLATFVACGSFRGVRDTRTPLVAAVAANAVNLAGDFTLMLWLRWGVAGAALATAASQWVSAAVLVALLLRRKLLVWEHVSRGPPRAAELAPLAKAAAALSVRNVSTMGVIFLGTSMVSAAGAVSLAAHEVLRQLYVVSVQAFSALDVATQSLVASFVGSGDSRSAREVLVRALTMAVAVGGAVGVALALAAESLPAAFTADPAVAAAAAAVIPLVAAFLPVDAAAAVLDGGLLGASDTAWVARSTLAVSAVCLAALLGARAVGAGLFGVWAALKTLSTGRAVAAALRYSMADGPLGTERAGLPAASPKK